MNMVLARPSRTSKSNPSVRTIKFLVGVSIALLLVACGDNGVQVTAKFANTQDIQDGTTVYLGDKVVGSVSDVSTTEHGSVVVMSLDTDLARAINSRAAVVVNRLRQGAPLELHNPPGAVIKPLENGQSVEALDSMLQLISWGITGSVTAGAQTITEFGEYLNSDEFEREKAELGIALDEGLKAAKDGLNEAQKTLDSVNGELNLSKEEVAGIVEDLGKEMAPVVKEVAQNGAELMAELQRFSDNLEQQSTSDKQAGRAFLKSLTKALETLNKSIDEGLEEGFRDQKRGS